MKILEKEIDLREETRSVEQARPALELENYANRSYPLAELQDGLGERVRKVSDEIRALPNGSGSFGKELAILGRVDHVMAEARDLLWKPETGPETIAAETEVIELLLQAKRINPNGGGGGGSSPGGGGGGTTKDSALALLGEGIAPNAAPDPREVGQGVGKSGRELPEEFRYGLDAYFNALEGEGGTR
ncbi:MAG: hypothetical protein RL885_04930 [Planctomycetota bacterium]